MHLQNIEEEVTLHSKVRHEKKDEQLHCRKRDQEFQDVKKAAATQYKKREKIQRKHTKEGVSADCVSGQASLKP